MPTYICHQQSRTGSKEFSCGRDLPGKVARPNAGQWGWALSAARFCSPAMPRYTLYCQISNHTTPNPSHKHPPLMAIRSPELPETPAALQAGVVAGTGLQKDEGVLTHIFPGNPALSMGNLKIQLKEIVQFLGNNFLSSSKAFHILHIATL